MKKFAVIIVLVSLALSLFLVPLNLYGKIVKFQDSSQTGAVRASLNLEGGYVEDIAIAPNGTVYAATNSPNGIFRSLNSGQTWQGPGNVDMGSAIAVEVDSSSNAYVIAGIDLYKSSDNGSNWSKLTAGKGDYDQTLLYAQNKLVVPSRNGSVDISTNGGASFTNAAVAGGSIRSLAASSVTTFYALVGSSPATLYKSTDGGATWGSTGKTGNYGVVGANSTTVVLAGSSGAAAAEYSTNEGASWSAMGNPGGGRHVTFNGSRVYIGNAWTDNNGATWHNLENEAASKTSILSGNAFAVGSAAMFISSGGGVARSTDGGANWSDVYEGMNAVTVNGISQANNKSVVWLAAQGGLAKTTNFTAANPTWSFPILPSPSAASASAVWVNPSNSNIVLAGALTNLYRSTDGGNTWSDVSGGLTSENVKDIVSSDGNTIYAGWGGGVLKSTDGGASFSNTGLANVPVNALAIGSDGSVYAGAGKEFDSTASTRGIYKYNGSSWTQLSGASGQLVNDVLVVGSSIFAAGGETNQGGVFVSKDAGASWSELKKGLPSDGWFKSLARESGTGNLYVSTSRPAGTSYIYKSMDNGQTWGLFFTGLKDEGFNALLFDKLVSGSNTGLYSYKSKAGLSLSSKPKIVKKGRRASLKVTLKDAATKKALKRRVVVLYKKVIKKKKVGKKWRNVAKWQRVRKARLNAKGQATIKALLGKAEVFQVQWKPSSKSDKNNYGTAKSKAVRIRVKK